MPRSLAVTMVALLAAACTDSPDTAPAAPAASRAEADAGQHVQYGVPVRVGNGRARAYVIRDAQAGNAPLEIGVALDSAALEGLPAPMPPEHQGMHDMHEYRLALPQNAPAPYRFVELDWNPSGHSAPYHVRPHFDFHFYHIAVEERNAIVRSDPQFDAKAARFPEPGYLPAGWLCPCALLPYTPGQLAEERMGLHWIDVTSPEYRPVPEGQPQDFTRTYIVGTWDGRVIFHEPMVTREYLLSRPEATAPVALAAQVAQPGWYPSAYRVRWDARAREYRVALAGLVAR